MSTQIGEQLGRARRMHVPAAVPDRLLGTSVKPVPRIALTEQEACASLGCSEEFFVEHIRPHLRVVHRGRQAAAPGYAVSPRVRLGS